jgi:hypothetical protein
MGSKQQAKASSTWAAKAKKDGRPVRTEMRCPIGHSHMVSLRNFINHLNTCPGNRRKRTK